MAKNEISIERLKQIEYTARRFHDIYFGRLGELGDIQGTSKNGWDDFSEEHRSAILYAVEMLEEEGTIEITAKG